MGWTSLTRGLPYGETPQSFLRKEMSYENATQRLEIVDDAMVGSTYYAAARYTDKQKDESYTLALVVLTSQRGGFGWKEMTESMGPYEADCPDRIMRLLSPLSKIPGSEDAAKWRERVAERKAARTKQRQVTARLRVGCKIDVGEPIRFQSGSTERQFELLPTPAGRRGMMWRSVEHGFLCRLPKAVVARATLAA